MTKDELKAHAERLGLKVKESWMDDAFENSIIAALSFIGGMIVMWIWK